MGKAARKKTNKKKQFYKDPKAENVETPMSKELLYGLDSADPKIRISTSGAISALFGDVQSDMQFTENQDEQYKANLEMILKSQLLKKIIGRATDNEYLVCMNILGALRNMCIVGGEDFILKISEMNVILPLKNLLYKYANSLGSGNDNDQIITCNLYYQLFSLLTILFDVDISGFYELESDANQNIYSVLLSLLSYTPSDNKKLQSFCSLMQISITEFISIIEDQLDASNPFLQQVLQLAESKDWNLRYRLANLCLDRLAPAQRVSLLESILQTLQTLSIPSLLASLTHCYEQFNELAAKEKETPEKEEVLDDAEASAKMDIEALDGNKKDGEREIVMESELLQQQITDYRVVLDVIAHALQSEQPLPLSETLLQQLIAFINTFIGQLETAVSSHTLVQQLQQQLLAGIIEVEAAVLSYLHDTQLLLTVWTQLIQYTTVSVEIASAVIKCLWVWSQLVVNQADYTDAINPVCFAEQIAPLTALLPSLPSEELVQLINLVSSLLQPVQPCAANHDCVREVCSQIVHVLDRAEYAGNPEIVGNVIDFMMTIFGNEKFVPIFKELDLNQYVYDATNALQTSLARQEMNLDNDCKEYLYEILDNAVRFIDWIQGGMK